MDSVNSVHQTGDSPCHILDPVEQPGLMSDSQNIPDTVSTAPTVRKPAGYAIGYLVLSDVAIFHYKQSTYFHGAQPFTIMWNDPRANIEWPVSETILSERDS